MKRSLFALSLVLLFAAPSLAQMNDLNARVDGLTWPFCAYGLEKRLSKMDEVDSVSIDLSEGLVVLKPRPGAVIDLHDLTDAIVGSGFSAREINVTLTGRVENWNGRLTLVVNGTERFFLAGPETIEQMEAVVGTPRLVTVSGVAAQQEAHKEHPYTIAVKTFELQWDESNIVAR